MTFRSFRFTSKIHKKMFKNLSKNLPKTIQNSTQKPPKTTIKKTMGKKTAKIDKKSEFGLPTGPRGGVLTRPFSTFFRVRSSLGHPWVPKWSQDLPQEPPGPPGPQFLMILTQFLMPVLDGFCRLGAHAWHGGGDWPAGQLDIYINIYINISIYTYIECIL